MNKLSCNRGILKRADTLSVFLLRRNNAPITVPDTLPCSGNIVEPRDHVQVGLATYYHDRDT